MYEAAHFISSNGSSGQPQLATVATMLLVAVIVGTSTISDDGSIGGMYRASLRFAERTYEQGAHTAARSAANINSLVGTQTDGEKSDTRPTR